jgi:hypothetical protein
MCLKNILIDAPNTSKNRENSFRLQIRIPKDIQV